MIEYLKIKNFRCHENLEVKFTNNLNVFVGESDVGKSAALRAIFWVFRNRPLGDDHRTWDSKETEVEIGIDGRKIIRYKSDTENYYQLDNKKLAAPDKGVPQEILNVINISDVNVQEQGDSHFLISNSSGEVGKYINGIVGLQVMDGSIQYASGKVKSINSEIREKNNKLIKLNKDINEYKWITKAEDDVVSLEKLDKVIKAQDIKLNKIQKLLDEYESLVEDLEKLQGLDGAKNDIDVLIGVNNELQQKHKEHERLSTLINDYYFYDEQLQDCIEVVNYGPKIHKLISIYEEYKLKEESCFKLFRLIQEYKKLKNDLIRVTKERDNSKREFDKLMPNQCPLCGK